MYNYKYDEETGGILLTTEKCKNSKEPRPVYAKELDLLGFNEKWKYSKRDDLPYMWAEAQNYYYRGKHVAKLIGGSLYNAPKIEYLEDPESDGKRLKPIDIISMCQKNRLYITGLIQTTKQNLYEVYKNYKEKIDVFYVAFSGGKDSVVALDIVKKTLPPEAFCVVFGDTGMEFPDTYDIVDKTEEICEKEKISFYRAKSHLDPLEAWNIFGPPATALRWCCSVHKTTPQILLLRKITGKPDFRGMAFTGVRCDESIKRSEYDYLCHGEKHKGQDSVNVILDWNSAELWIYIYANELLINECYKKGNGRAGCLVCPGASLKHDYMNHLCYSNEYDKYLEIIKKCYRPNFKTEESFNQYIENQGWKARKNSEQLEIDGKNKYIDEENENELIITVKNANTDWKEWIKTIGSLSVVNEELYSVKFNDNFYEFKVIEEDDKNYKVVINSNLSKENPGFVKLFKNVFRKAAYCIKCGECEADCCFGNIDFSKENFISEKCISCNNCHKPDKGCLLASSLKTLVNKNKDEKNKIIFISLNSYSHHAPELNWFEHLFIKKENYINDHRLGSEKINKFKSFLKHCEIYDSKNNLSPFAEVLFNYGLKNPITWALMLCNMAYNSSQINWYINNIEFNKVYEKNNLIEFLELQEGVKNRANANDITKSLQRILQLPFGDMLGYAETETDKRGNTSLISIRRHGWENIPDLDTEKVILYSLYKYAEKTDVWTITVSRLYDTVIKTEGISPAKIFGIDRETLIPFLNTMSSLHSDFCNVTFTHDLEHIVLYKEKKDNILDIFKGE